MYISTTYAWWRMAYRVPHTQTISAGVYARLCWWTVTIQERSKWSVRNLVLNRRNLSKRLFKCFRRIFATEPSVELTSINSTPILKTPHTSITLAITTKSETSCLSLQYYDDADTNGVSLRITYAIITGDLCILRLRTNVSARSRKSRLWLKNVFVTNRVKQG